MAEKIYANYKEWLNDELKNPKLAIAYLNEAIKDEDQAVFLLALKDVIEANGGDMTKIAKQAQLNRQNLYRMLSQKGNPRWDSILSLFNALNIQVQLSFKR